MKFSLYQGRNHNTSVPQHQTKMARFLALLLSLCLFSSAAAEQCFLGTADAKSGPCMGFSMPTRYCDGEDGTEGALKTAAHGVVAELVDVDTCETGMKAACAVVGGEAATGAAACASLCTGIAYCDTEDDCPAANGTVIPRPICCSACEAIFTDGCVGAEAASITSSCETAGCKNTECRCTPPPCTRMPFGLAPQDREPSLAWSFSHHTTTNADSVPPIPAPPPPAARACSSSRRPFLSSRSSPPATKRPLCRGHDCVSVSAWEGRLIEFASATPLARVRPPRPSCGKAPCFFPDRTGASLVRKCPTPHDHQRALQGYLVHKHQYPAVSREVCYFCKERPTIFANFLRCS